jgi:methionyl-tRNA formyltransferase
VAQAAERLGLMVSTPERSRDPEFVQYIEGLELEALVVAAYGQILSGRLLDAAVRGGINLHGSILPKFRGAAPIARAIEAGESTTGVTLMQMDRGMDTGDIISIEETHIGPTETAGDLEARLASIAAKLIADWIPAIASGNYPRTPQDDSAASYAAKLTRKDSLLSFEMTAETAYRVFRAMTPKPGAFLQTQRGLLKVIECSPAPESGEPGSVISKSSSGLQLAMASESLLLHMVQPENKGRISGNDFANGRRLVEGDTV